VVQFRNLIGNILLLGTVVAFLVHFALIGIYGRQLIQEPSPAIYWLEVSFFILCLGIAVSNIVMECKQPISRKVKMAFTFPSIRSSLLSRGQYIVRKRLKCVATSTTVRVKKGVKRLV